MGQTCTAVALGAASHRSCSTALGEVGEKGYCFFKKIKNKIKKAIFQSTETVYSFLPNWMTHSGILPSWPSPLRQTNKANNSQTVK